MNIRFTILLVVILVVIGGTVWITQRGDDTADNETEPWLWKVELEDIDSIAVTHQDQAVSYRRQDTSWVIAGEPDVPVYQPKWGGMTLIVSGPRPARILSDTIEDPSLYGLAPPVTTVKVIDRSGQTVGFDLGALTPDGGNQYIRMIDGNLSTVPRIWGEVVARMATEPPYTPPFVALLDNDLVEEFRITLRNAERPIVVLKAPTEEAISALESLPGVLELSHYPAANVDDVNVFQLTLQPGEDLRDAIHQTIADNDWSLRGFQFEESETIYLLTDDEEWIQVGGTGAPVDMEQWGRMTAGLADAGLEVEAEEAGDLADFGPDNPAVISLDLRNSRDETIEYLIGDPAPGSERRYLRKFGDDALSAVDNAWVARLLALATDPPLVADAGS